MKNKEFRKLVLSKIDALTNTIDALQESIDLTNGNTYSINQTCKILGCSRTTLQKLRDTDQISFLGGVKIEFTRLHILEYQRSREVKAKAVGLESF